MTQGLFTAYFSLVTGAVRAVFIVSLTKYENYGNSTCRNSLVIVDTEINVNLGKKSVLGCHNSD